MNKQKTSKIKSSYSKTGAKNNHKHKNKYFTFDAADKKWQGIYSFIIK